MRHSRLLISLPLLFLPLALPGLSQSAHANALDTEQATVVLARAHGLNGKCQFLSPAASDELSSYIARAEIAAAEQLGVETARAALQRGTAAAKQAPCDEAMRSEVNETLSAAREAISQAGTMAAAQTAAAQPAQLAPAQKPAKKVAAAKPAAGKAKPAGLGSYAQMAETYYLARRCGSMSARQISKYYKSVVSTHRSSVAAYGVPAVAAVLKKAEARAKARSCV
jgi:hypothetical protein